MHKDPKRVPLETDTDLLHILEEVYTDKIPRLIEREGEPLAVVVSSEDYEKATFTPKSKRLKQELLALAGVWSDLDADLDADRLIEELYKARDAAPPSPPIEL